jgi:CrcB protein
MQSLLWVGFGGALGAMLRFAVSGWVHRSLSAATFPWGTFLVNVLGCLALGVVNGFADSRGLFGPEARLFLFIGLLGGFTTFSTFAFESMALARDAEAARALVNLAGQVILGLSAAWIGYVLARSI